MVLSLWYLYEGGKLYCATQQSARVVAYLEHDDRCAFEVASERPPYCGVRGQGRAAVNAARGGEILERLLVRYLGGTDGDLARGLLAKRENEVAIVIEPVKVFTWDFSQRMQDVQAPEAVGLCPLLGDT
jgi:nitroimidazol reductase NimA-like FMN-containing flavoprotein (pyridoxamine 5'-phosphate oxidase superfamily)